MKSLFPSGMNKRAYIQAIRAADANELFFSKDTMKFFGRQTYDITDDGLFEITFLQKCPRIALYSIDPTNYKLHSHRRQLNASTHQ